MTDRWPVRLLSEDKLAMAGIAGRQQTIPWTGAILSPTIGRPCGDKGRKARLALQDFNVENGINGRKLVTMTGKSSTPHKKLEVASKDINSLTGMGSKYSIGATGDEG